MLYICCFRQRTNVAQGLFNGVLNETWTHCFHYKLPLVGQAGLYRGRCSSFLECVYFGLLYPSLIFDIIIVVCVCVCVCVCVGVVLGFTNILCVCVCVCVGHGGFCGFKFTDSSFSFLYIYIYIYIYIYMSVYVYVCFQLFSFVWEHVWHKV